LVALVNVFISLRAFLGSRENQRIFLGSPSQQRIVSREKTRFSSLAVIVPRNNADKALEQGIFLSAGNLNSQALPMLYAKAKERQNAVTSNPRPITLGNHHRMARSAGKSHKFCGWPRMKPLNGFYH
jgi:hypothetical protein